MDNNKNLNKEDFILPTYALNENLRSEALEKLNRYLLEKKENFLGYQAHQGLDYKTDLAEYLNYEINNLGDPFQDGDFRINSKVLEQTVLDYYAHLWNGKPYNSKDPESCWGYITSMGSSEANLYGLWNGRDYLAGKFLLNSNLPGSVGSGIDRGSSALRGELEDPKAEDSKELSPILFYSDQTHYSVKKASVVLRLKRFDEIGNTLFEGKCPLTDDGRWKEGVPTLRSGEIDIDALVKLVEFFANEGYPILINFNYGTAFKGAYDNVKEAGERLMEIFKKYGLYKRKIRLPENGIVEERHGFWFHVDGALGAAYMPFIQMAKKRGQEENLLGQPFPEFDFGLEYVSSISMSGHKWIGAPFPCGIYMTKRKHQLKPTDKAEYVGADDTTFAGSRNGFSALVLWDYLAKNSYLKQIGRAIETQRLAAYAEARLKSLRDVIDEDLQVERSPLSLSVRFRKVSEEIIEKYSLSEETDTETGIIFNHLYAMPHVTEEVIEKLVEDIRTHYAV